MPWQASYEAARLLGGNVRYVLFNGGHVASIVNPPGPKARHEVRKRTPAHRRRVAGVSGEPQRFLVGGDWTRWAGERAGP